VTPADLLQAELRRDGARPLVTWYDDATGDRVELSVATAANWAAKTANLLGDEHGLDAGDTVGLDPRTHWLSAVAVLGAWTAGIGVDVTDADTVVVLPGDPASFMRAVLPQPDALLTGAADGAETGLVTTQGSLTLEQLADVGSRVALPPRCRLLSTMPLDTLPAFDAAVLVPLAAGGSVVQVADADPEKLAARAQTERVTHCAGVDIAGVARLL
jgi:hypothetical protein